MDQIKTGDRVRINARENWPTPPGYRFANAEGTVEKWVEWDETMDEFKEFIFVKISKAESGAEEFIGKREFFHVSDLEKI